MSGHSAAAEAYISGQLATARALLVDLAEVLDSLGATIVTQPQDHSADHRDAWLWGILLGWDEALPSVAEKHGWDDATVARLGRYRDSVTKALANQKT